MADVVASLLVQINQTGAQAAAAGIGQVGASANMAAASIKQFNTAVNANRTTVNNYNTILRQSSTTAKQTKKDWTDMFTGLVNARSGVEGMIGGLLRMGTGLYLINRAFTMLKAATYDVAKKFYDAGAEVHTFAVRLEALTGSTASAAIAFGKLQALSRERGIDLGIAQDTVARLKGFGIETARLVPLAEKFAIATRGDVDAMNRLALVFGQVTQQGRTYGDDLRQLFNVGVPIAGALADALEAPPSRLRQLAKEGAITAKVLETALNKITEAGTSLRESFDRLAEETAQGRWKSAFESIKQWMGSVGLGVAQATIPLAQDIARMASTADQAQQFQNFLGQYRKGAVGIGNPDYTGINLYSALFGAQTAFSKEQMNVEAAAYGAGIKELRRTDIYGGGIVSGNRPKLPDKVRRGYIEAEENLAAIKKLIADYEAQAKAEAELAEKERKDALALASAADAGKDRQELLKAYQDELWFITQQEAVLGDLYDHKAAILKVREEYIAKARKKLGLVYTDPLYAGIAQIAEEEVTRNPLLGPNTYKMGLPDHPAATNFLGEYEGIVRDMESALILAKGDSPTFQDYQTCVTAFSAAMAEGAMTSVDAAAALSAMLKKIAKNEVEGILRDPNALVVDKELLKVAGREYTTTGNEVTDASYRVPLILQRGKYSPLIEGLRRPLETGMKTKEGPSSNLPGVTQWGINIDALIEAQNKLESTFKGQAADALTDVFRTIGEGGNILDSMVASLQELGSQMGTLFIEAGLTAIIDRNYPLGLFLLAAGGISTIASASPWNPGGSNKVTHAAVTGAPMTINALGGVYGSPSLSAYSGGIFNSPRMFAFANGAGVFAEAGPEAIMPLTRTASGELGVRAAGGSNVVVQIIDQTSGKVAIATEEVTQPDGSKLIRALVRDMVRAEMTNTAIRKNGIRRQ